MTDAAVAHRRLRIALLLVGGVLWVIVFVVLYFLWQQRRQSVVDTPNGENVPQASPVFHTWEVSGFHLTECRGRTVRKADLLGRPWVASFLFTRCRGACPRVAAQLQMLKDRIGETGVRLVTFTVDPENDTPEVLKHYAAELQAEPERWLFLTGKPKDVYDLVQHGFKMSAAQRQGPDRKPGYEVIHSKYVLLVDGKGFVVGRYDGTDEIEMTKLERAIRNLDTRDGPSRNGGKPAHGG